jgi:subfamily B ATP-binding cassette protein MsbA
MVLYLRLLNFVRPYWVKLALAMIFMSLVAATNGLTAYIVKPVLDKIFFEKNAEMLYIIPFGVILIYLFKGVFEYLQAYLMGFVGQKIVNDIRNIVFQSLQRQPLSFFDKTPTGASISRVMNDVNLLQSSVTDSLTAIMKDILSIVVLVFVVFYRDWKLATIALIILPFSAYPIIAFGK